MAGSSDVWTATRTMATLPFSTLSEMHLSAVDSSAQELDPEIAAYGFTLMFSRIGSNQHVLVTSRTSLTSNFGTPVVIPAIDGVANDADPAASLDRTILVFSSDRPGGPGGGDLWYTTRADATMPYDPPRLVPDINSPDPDADAWLSRDGCRIYFSANLALVGNFDLYVATAR